MFIFAVVYLSIPVFLILFTFFSTPFVLMSAVALIVIVFCLYKCQQSGHSRDFRLRIFVDYWPLLLVSLVVTYLCVVSPFKIWDWEKHYAVFNSLIQNSWPPVVELGEQTWFLRYFPAYYVLPALFAKILGSQLLTVSMFIWTATGLFTALFLAFSHLQQKPRHLFVAALIFFFFAGLDIVGAWLNGYVPPLYPHWPQIWISWGEIWPALTGIAWTPQHVLGGWVGACLFLYNRRLAVEYSAVIIVIISLWSAFPAIGLIPIAVWALIKEGYRAALTPQNLLTAPIVAVSVAMYLMQGAGAVPLMFVWEHSGFSISGFVIFCVFEFLLILGILYFLMKKERDLIITLACFLVCLCLIRFGVYNDLLMRGAIPSICIMSILVFRALLGSQKLWREIITIYLFICSFPVAVAFILGISPSMGRVDKSMDFKKMTSLYTYEEHPHMTYNYVAKTKDAISFFGVPLMRGLPENRLAKK